MEYSSSSTECSSRMDSALQVDVSCEATDNDHPKSCEESTFGRIKKLKRDMLKIRKDQKSIRKSQTQAWKKLAKIKKDHAFIKSEAEEIARLNERTQQRLSLIFMILEARKNNDIVKANILVGSLRLLLSSSTK
ncbi:hypothetical protein ACFE04_027368 [Oxalis oulophora]